MEITATFANASPLSIQVDPWAVNSAIDTFMEMGALTVTTR
jgi:hypothetical protein